MSRAQSHALSPSSLPMSDMPRFVAICWYRHRLCEACDTPQVGARGASLRERQPPRTSSMMPFVADSCDGKELAGLAKRWPTVKQTKDTETTSKLHAQRRCAVKLADLALKYPDLAMQVWGQAEPLLQRHLADKEEQSDKFSEQYRRVWRLPGTWKGSWITMISDGKILDKHLADLVAKHNGARQIVHDLFYYLTYTSPNDALPPLCHSKKVCSRVFAMRFKEAKLQNRVAKVADLLKSGSNVQSLDLSPYEIMWGEDGLATKVKHDSGAEATMSKDDTFSQAWKLFEPSLGSSAYVAAPKSKRTVALCSYFDDGEGPKVALESISSLASTAHRQIEEDIERLKNSLVSDSSGAGIAHATKEHKRSLAQARAKAMVAARKKAKLDSGVSLQTT